LDRQVVPDGRRAASYRAAANTRIEEESVSGRVDDVRARALQQSPPRRFHDHRSPHEGSIFLQVCALSLIVILSRALVQHTVHVLTRNILIEVFLVLRLLNRTAGGSLKHRHMRCRTFWSESHVAIRSTWMFDEDVFCPFVVFFTMIVLIMMMFMVVVMVVVVVVVAVLVAAARTVIVMVVVVVTALNHHSYGVELDKCVFQLSNSPI
jgi:hypothetical protein